MSANGRQVIFLCAAACGSVLHAPCQMAQLCCHSVPCHDACKGGVVHQAVSTPQQHMTLSTAMLYTEELGADPV